MRVPGRQACTDDKNMKFVEGFRIVGAVTRMRGRGRAATSRATTLPGTCKAYAAAPKTAQAPSIRSKLPVDAL